MTRNEFTEWVSSPITKEVFAGLKSRVDFLKDKLADTAGYDPLEDSMIRGYVKAFNDLLLTEYEGDEE